MPTNNRPTEDELQEKALYDILQYLPLDEVELKDGYSINKCISIIERDKNLSKSGKKAIEETLPTIEAILKDRPELGKAKISNMSWKDNDGAGNNDHYPEGMQACAKIKADIDILGKGHLVLREFSAFFLNALRVNITKNT